MYSYFFMIQIHEYFSPPNYLLSFRVIFFNFLFFCYITRCNISEYSYFTTQCSLRFAYEMTTHVVITPIATMKITLHIGNHINIFHKFFYPVAICNHPEKKYIFSIFGCAILICTCKKYLL